MLYGREVNEWRAFASIATPLGSTSSADTIVMLSDYQCPFCRIADSVIFDERAGQQIPFSIRIIHLPLAMLHPYATEAAVASECAAMQGAFEQFHGVLFAAQDSIGIIDFPDFARRANVSHIDRFELCLTESTARARVKQHEAIASELQVTGTPAFIIRGKLFVGPTVPQLKQELLQIL